MRRSGWFLVVFVLALAVPRAPAQKAKGKADPVVQGKTVGAWARALAGKDALARVRAVNALMQAGPEARSAAAALVELFHDDRATFLHPLAAVALGRIGGDAVAPLQQALGDKSAPVKRNAALTLGLIGPAAGAAVPALAAALKDGEPTVRQAAAEALGRIGAAARPAAARLHDRLADADGPVRVEAALALWRAAGDVRGVKALAALVGAGDDALALHAVEGLGEIGPRARGAAAALTAGLEAKAAARRIAAAEALFRVGGDPAVCEAALVRELEAPAPADRRLAVAALGTLGGRPAVVTRLAGLLTDADVAVRREAACALCEPGVKAAGARAALDGGLRDADAGVRWWSSLALAGGEADVRKREEELLRALQAPLYRLPEPPSRGVLEVLAARRAAPALAVVVRSRSGPLAAAAARALAALGIDVRPAADELFAALGAGEEVLAGAAAAAVATMNVDAVPRLARLLGNADGRLRAGAAEALGLIGLPARRHVAALTRLLRDAEAPVRTAAAVALWRIDGDADAALRALVLVLKDVDGADRWAAIDGVGVISVEARPPIRGLTEVLVGALKDRDVRVRLHAARWLWRRTRQARVIVPLIQEGVGDRDGAVRRTAVEILGEMGAEDRVLSLLAAALEDRTAVVRLAAVEGMARSVPVKQLVEQLDGKKPRLRRAAVRALGLVGPDARASLPALIGHYGDADALTRAAILETVSCLFPDRPAEVDGVRGLLQKLEGADRAAREGIMKDLETRGKKLLAAAP